MKLFTYLFCLLSLAYSTTIAVFAQGDPEDKMSVAVLPFTSSAIVKAEDVETIYGQVTEAFVNTRRFTIIERKNHAAVFAELEKQKQEIYMSSTNLAKQGMQLGANYLIIGDVGAGSSNGAVSVTLKLVDVETSEIIASKNISSDNSGTKKTLSTAADILALGNAARKNYPSPSDVAITSAGKNAINNLSVSTLDIGRQVKNFINEYFPLNSKIISIEGQKGDEAQKVLISMGEGMSLKKGQILYVFEETLLEAGGKKLRRKTQLGKIRIESIEGGVSVCKVSDGGEAILKRFAGKEVYVSTNQSK